MWPLKWNHFSLQQASLPSTADLRRRRPLASPPIMSELSGKQLLSLSPDPPLVLPISSSSSNSSSSIPSSPRYRSRCYWCADHFDPYLVFSEGESLVVSPTPCLLGLRNWYEPVALTTVESSPRFGLLRMEEYDKALECLKGDGLQPNENEYNKMIQTLCLKDVDWQTAEKLLEEMKDSGLHIKARTGSLVTALKELVEEEVPTENAELETA